MRCIDADALIDDCKKYLNKLNPSRDGKECTRIHWLIGVLSNVPTIEPERKKGKWINIRHDNIAECDQCGITGRAWMNFCFDCGADMREDGEADAETEI